MEQNIACSSTSETSSNKNKKISWPKAHSEKQEFSLPDSIIYYITKNPSTPKAYSKLTKSCKYFFEKNPILIVSRILEFFGRKFCSHDDMDCRSKYYKCCVSIDIARTACKIWLIDHLKFLDDCSSLNASTLLLSSKIYRCENALLWIGVCKFAMEEFKLWASKFQRFCCGRTKIIDDDGRSVMLEEIMAAAPNIKEFQYCFHYDNSGATAATMKNIMKLKNLDNLQYFHLSSIPAIFDVRDLADFTKVFKNTKIWLTFYPFISEEYKKQLDQLIDEAIHSGIPNRLIIYDKQDQRKLYIMKSRYCR